MIDHNAIQLAMRARLLDLLVCTTGLTTLAATATGYVRTSGSFFDDHFARGMEITPLGFAVSTPDTITGISADGRTITTKNARPVDRAAAGRSLSVQLPAMRQWENEETFTRITGVPYVDEQYARGPAKQDTIGPASRISGLPMYLPRVNVPAGTGITAASRYAAAIVNAYPPGDVISLPGGDTIEVRADQAPYSGQLLPGEPGFAGLLCMIPLRCRSINSR